jgi:hypothetical protein
MLQSTPGGDQLLHLPSHTAVIAIARGLPHVKGTARSVMSTLLMFERSTTTSRTADALIRQQRFVPMVVLVSPQRRVRSGRCGQ